MSDKHPMFEVVSLTRSYRSRSEDRLDVIDHPLGVVAIVADGAGGTSGSAEAADTAILWTRAYVTRIGDTRGSAQWRELLANVDRQINCENGETTAVVA